MANIYTYIYIHIYMVIWLRKKTNKLQVHPYKPVSWLPTHLMSGQPRNRLVRMNL